METQPGWRRWTYWSLVISVSLTLLYWAWVAERVTGDPYPKRETRRMGAGA
jgi:hypothetical protein